MAADRNCEVLAVHHPPHQFISARSRLNRRAVDSPMDDALQQSAPDNPIASVALAEIARAIEALLLEQRTTLLLVVMEGLTCAEAATATGVPVCTIMSCLATARRALADKIKAGSRLARVK
jgi:RNA polymerase sigma-70 factor, ECF subfamily